MSLHIDLDRESGGQEQVTSAEELLPPRRHLPIVVDLDGTLTLSDTLDESLLLLVLRKPLSLTRVLPRLGRGKAAFKAALAAEIDLAEHPLPMRDDLVRWLSDKAAEGHEIHLCSGANQLVAETVAGRLQIFESATGSDTMSLTAEQKARHLRERFPDGYIYVGDSSADLPVWAAAEGVVLAGTRADTGRRARLLEKPVHAEFLTPALSARDIAKALRVHHWTKNLLLFVPLILAHQWNDAGLIIRTCAAFLCLLAVTSATYLLNDIADVGNDRRHWSKRHRAIASGRLSIRHGLLVSLLLLIAGMAAAVLISAPFAGTLLAYVVLTCAYSFWLKSVPLLDTLLIGILFTLRLLMGAVLLDSTRPAWLLTFSVFFFFSLAVAKRHTEIVRTRMTDSAGLRGRGYQVEDAPLTLSLGIATAVASLVVLFIFIVLEMWPADSYRNPEFLVGFPVILSIWLGRIWLLAHRGLMNDDPVSFAIRDKVSIYLGLLVVAFFLAAL